MLLVVTNKTDLACDYLILRLREKDISFTRLNTEDFGLQYEIDLSIAKERADFVVSFSSGKALTSKMIKAVYFRQPILPDPPSDVAPSDRDFAKREIGEHLRSLWRLIEQEKWINHPRNLWLATNKIEQLSIAKEIGFVIPETFVTRSIDLVKKFFSKHHGRVVCKAVKHGFTYRENTATVAMTQRIDRRYLKQADAFASIPMIYQNEIIKIFDIRVIVVGDSVFATAIYSQEHTETEVDWRAWDACDFDLRHESITLPKFVSDCCLKITRYFNLKYSAIDLILGKDGIYYFLEMNPNGQWAWIEQKVDHPIRDTLIQCMGYCSVDFSV